MKLLTLLALALPALAIPRVPHTKHTNHTSIPANYHPLHNHVPNHPLPRHHLAPRDTNLAADTLKDDDDTTVAERARFRLDKIMEYIPECMTWCFNETYRAAGCAQKDDYLCLCRNTGLFADEPRYCMIEACGEGNIETSRWEQSQRTICSEVLPKIMYRRIRKPELKIGGW